jgi:hypothetical protein
MFPSLSSLERNEDMAIDPLSQVYKSAVIGDPARNLNHNLVYDQGNRQAETDGGKSDSVTLQGVSSTMGKIGALNEEKIRIAKGIRETDSALQGVSDTIEKMKAQLEKIVKNWPPFNPDSAERKEYLMSCVSLRKEILKMTVPPPPKPVYEGNTTVWGNLGINGNGKISLPEISDTATDAQLKTVLNQLEKTASAVEAGKKDLVHTVTG